MSGMKVIKCTCAHSYQDELYGPGNRIANPTAHGQYTCTVCGKMSGVAGTAVASAPIAAAPAAVKKKETPSKVKKNPVNNTDKKSPTKKGSLKGGKR